MRSPRRVKCLVHKRIAVTPPRVKFQSIQSLAKELWTNHENIILPGHESEFQQMVLNKREDSIL